jgi:CutA1 divalent ion tolerance protein
MPEDQTMVDAAKAGLVVALSTAASPVEARRIATALVVEQLAACVNIIDNIHSIYRWQGAQPYLDWLLASTSEFQKTS